MPPITPDEQARALSEWLDSPVGTPVPDGVDPEVLETVFAMRPNLAPPPRVEVDDILALVTAGPLAGEPDSLVQAPVEAIPEPANDPRPSRWIAWGGTSLLLVAMAALFAVQLDAPVYSPPVAQEPTTSSMPPVDPVVADEAVEEEELALDGDDEADRAAEALDQMAALEKAAREARSPSQPKRAAAKKPADPSPERRQAAPSADDDFGGAPEGGASLEDGWLDAPAVAEAAVTTPPPREEPLATPRAEPEPEPMAVDMPPPAPPKTVAKKEARSASDRLAAIQPPAKSGMRAAIDAAEYFLSVQDSTRAAAACQKGLALSTENTRERERLLRLLGDARTAMGDPVTAAEAYKEAETLRNTR